MKSLDIFTRGIGQLSLKVGTPACADIVSHDDDDDFLEKCSNNNNRLRNTDDDHETGSATDPDDSTDGSDATVSR